MTRTIVTLPDADKRWLERYSRAHKVSMASIIRRALRQLRRELERNAHVDVLRKTSGIWRKRNGDGLEYVSRLRNEWGG
ncbi:MAG: CopG family transcriptional regulator [Candidatus Hydrogenedentota bacterium]|nr:MAG: CopG family transcriptional regulator [Candidatus Hydrogenedentota bacterium]